MWIQFLLENAHFAVNIFAALVTFAVFWLYLDAWRARKTLKEGIRIGGFALLSLSFIVHAVTIETSLVVAPIINGAISDILLSAVRLPAYLLLIASLLIEPLEAKPGATRVRMFILPTLTLTFIGVSHFLYPMLAIAVGFLYLRRSTVGLENHLKTIALCFFLLGIAEFLGMAALFRTSTNVAIYKFVAPFGPVWIAEHVAVLFLSILLGRWVFGYLLKQFNTQIFIIFTTITIAIFLMTTVSFTGLLVKNIQNETLKQLETDVRVLQYTLESKKAESISDSQVIAQNAQIVLAVVDKDRKALSDFAQDFLLTKKITNVIVTGETGQVLARGEDRDRTGDSLSDDPLVKRALLGETASSVVTRQGVVAPQIIVQAATPIKNGSEIVGAVLIGTSIDTAFVDGMKTATGLESSIYGDAQVSATTLVATDGTTRLVGILLSQKNIKETVLTSGLPYSGPVTIANVAYFGSYVPLKDVDGGAVGMLFVGKPQTSVLATAGRSIELTFLVTVALILFSIIPTYMIARYIANQID